jgi:hypothetical protein
MLDVVEGMQVFLPDDKAAVREYYWCKTFIV